MKRLLYIVICVATVAAVAVSCNNVGCTDNQNSVPLAGFYSMSTFEQVSLSGIDVGGVGAPADSLLIKSEGFEAASQVYMPLRSTSDVTRYFISYRQPGLDSLGLADTITFRYTSIPYFASEECGAMYHYRITSLQYTRLLIDSIGLTDSTITNVERETIKIYFRTAQPDTIPDEQL